jgi:hypothetical protein
MSPTSKKTTSAGTALCIIMSVEVPHFQCVPVELVALCCLLQSPVHLSDDLPGTFCSGIMIHGALAGMR